MITVVNPQGNETMEQSSELINEQEEFTYKEQDLHELIGNVRDPVENTWLVQSAVQLNNKRFVKNLKLLLKHKTLNL